MTRRQQSTAEVELPRHIAEAAKTLEGKHREKCPADPFETEMYSLPRPKDQGGGYCTITRCRRCGIHHVQRPDGVVVIE